MKSLLVIMNLLYLLIKSSFFKFCNRSQRLNIKIAPLPGCWSSLSRIPPKNWFLFLRILSSVYHLSDYIHLSYNYKHN